MVHVFDLMSSPKVLVIGCGIAGPVIALLLKKKGYDPIVLEKVRELGDAGASLLMCPNGLKVLELLDIARFVTDSTSHIEQLCDRTSCGEVLGLSDLPLTFKKNYGQPACGVKRTALNLALKDALTAAKVKICEGWKLKDIVESECSVTAISEDNEKIEGSFLIGCDGIKAASRHVILRQHGIDQEEATYTGLTQIAGMSPTPYNLLPQQILLNIYGPGAHFICYPVSTTTTSWAITQRNLNAAQETWKIFSCSDLEAIRTELLNLLGDWCAPVPELILGAERIIKYGLYDRPQLEPDQWYSMVGRCVLIGDAGHPTSPHLGQGANQALEDCYHLSKLLPDYSTGQESKLETSNLQQIFKEFAGKRQPRTAALVKGARTQGEIRVCDGSTEVCSQRDNIVKKKWDNKAAVETSYDELFKEPF